MTNSKRYPVSLRRAIFLSASRALERSAPDYVQQIRSLEVSDKEIGSAFATLKAFLPKNFDNWHRLLEATINIELSFDQLVRAVGYLAAEVNSSPSEAGAWVEYHAERWVTLSATLLERYQRMTILVGNDFGSRKVQTWRNDKIEIEKSLREMLGRVNPIRHPVVHGEGWGTRGISESRLWEQYLAASGNGDGLLDNFYEANVNTENRKLEPIEHITRHLLDQLSAIDSKLASYVQTSIDNDGSASSRRGARR